MLRIQYHRYSGPEEMRLETYELPASANMFMIRAPFPRAIGTDFSGVVERKHRPRSSTVRGILRR
jgi:hypothetical protein